MSAWNFKSNVVILMVPAIWTALAGSAAQGGDPWADAVLSYVPGSNAEPDYAFDPTVALGPPERITGKNTPFGSFPGGVTVFSSPWGLDEIISVGAGGHLVVRFDQPILDSPANPFGVDLIVFGNAFFTLDFPAGTTVTGIAADPGVVEVSADGLTWFTVTGAADALFPTQGHLDSGIFGDPIGTMPTDILRPVDPSLTMADFLGKTYPEVLALYDGSGGGAPIDISTTGLSSASFVRISVPDGTGWSAEIDAFAAVPEPCAALLLAAGCLALVRRRARQ